MTSSNTTIRKDGQVSHEDGKAGDKSSTQQIPNKRPMQKASKTKKSATAFRTISEVADELGVQQHVLRFWESKFSHVKPMKRGGGRRYYRPEDIDLLKQIHHLLYQEGYTIKGVQKLLTATRGNLAARVAPSLPELAEKAAAVEEAAATETQVEEAPKTAATAEKKQELKAMLDELKSMRRLLQD